MRHPLPAVVLLAVLCLSWSGCAVAPEPAAPRAAPEAEAPGAAPSLCARPYVFTVSEDRFLDDLQQRIVDYFWTEVYPETGIAIDHTENRMGKVAATGFELAAICIGVERGWIPYQDGYDRTLKILNAFWDDPDDPDDPYAEGQFGLYWHFVDGRTGKMSPIDCVAMCDSADFIAGAVVAGEYFKGTEIETLARRIYDNVEWDQFVAKRADGSPDLLSFGWVPLGVSESYPTTDGLLTFNMSGFADNSLLIYVLALGSDTHPIPQATWDRYVDTYTLGEYGGYECVMTSQLFCRQVPHAFIPFSRLRDRKIDYWLDTVNALLADRVFNMVENNYPPQLWGLTDVFGKDSYSHGAPPGPVMNDGTIGTTAFAGALPHVPDLSLEAMAYVMQRFGDRVFGRYGFTSSVNQQNDFVSPLYVGIELGPMVQLIENARSGLIWDLFRRTRVMQNFVVRAGICGVVDDFELPPEAPAYARWCVRGGRAKPGTDAPQHGRKCLEIRPDGDALRLEANLPANQLTAYGFNRYLSIWARDLELLACTITLDGRPVALEAAGTVPGREWVQHFYMLPRCAPMSEVCVVALDARATGERAALDNVTMEMQADLGGPEAVNDFEAATGEVGGRVELRWTAPRDTGSDRVVRYLVTARRIEPEGETLVEELPAVAEAGAREERAMLLEPDARYELAIAAVDGHGHTGPASAPVEVRAAPGTLSRVQYDFENGSLEGWENPQSNWVMRIVKQPDGGRAVGVEFDKYHGWNHLYVALDPEMVALHRYITLRVRGKVELLGKLWCSQELQQDAEAFGSKSEEQWTEFRLDTRKANLINPARDPVRKLILFPNPGQWSGKGWFMIDDLGYANDTGR